MTCDAVTLVGRVNLTDTSRVSCGVIYDTSLKLSSSNGTKEGTMANGDYSVNLSGLKANTTYYYRAYALDADLYKYGEISSFKTDISVTTIQATDITHNGAILSGSVNSSGEELTCGIIYGTSSTLTPSNGVIESTISSGSYFVTLSGLKADVTYYFCAFAIIDGKYRYGEICSFKTKKEIKVTTGEATNITIEAVTLGGTIHNSDELLECGIIYDTSSILSSSNGTKMSTTSLSTFSITVSDLNPNTTYYYRAYVVVDSEYKYGEVLSFKTIKEVTVSTGSATNVTDNGATLSGTINNSDKSLTCGIIYGINSSLSSTSGMKKSTTSSGTYSIMVSDLNPNTTYYYCAYVVVDDEYKYGEVCSFKTVKEIAVITGDVTNITDISATLKGSVSGADKVLECGIIYGINSSLSSTSGMKKSTTSSGTYSIMVSDLNPNTTYYYRAYAVVDGEYKYGEVSSFKTVKEVTISTGSVTNITDSGATLSGTINNSDKSLTCGIIYGTNSSLSSSSGTKKSTTSSGAFSVSLTGLIPNTTYYYRAYAVVDGEYKYGEVSSFKTVKEVTVSTGSATDVTDSGVTLSGTINNSDKSLTCGIIYGTNSSLSSSSGTNKSTTSSGAFSVSLTGLSPNTTYYYRAYVVVDGEYKYGEVSSFKTIKEVTVSTGSATDVTDSGATLSGTINNSDKSLTCGIIYGTSSSLSSSSGTKQSTTSSGIYTITISDLNPNTTYYYRAFVIVDDEYRYGEVSSFITLQENFPIISSHEPVDLGLSVKWASCNVGATSPEEYGGYYAWGETEEKKIYDRTTYKWYSDNNYTRTKYCTKQSYYDDIVDGKSILDLDDDVATLKKGDGWRIPNVMEINELVDNCSWELVEYKGVNGYKITGSNGNSIFFPMAGNYNGTEICNVGIGAIYWVRELDTDYNDLAYALDFSGGGFHDLYTFYRYIGCTIRPVYDISSLSTSVTTGSATDITDEGVILRGIINNCDNSVTCGIIYDTSSNLSSSKGTKKSTTSYGTFSVSLTGLSSNTTYYYRAYAIVDGEYKYGEVLSFKTLQGESPNVSTYEAIDLGLSVKWASCNVGANSPEDCGGYYAWGETKEKNYYDWSTYKWCNGDCYTITKYTTNSNFGAVDNKTTLDLSDDVAHVNWGGSWRMPTSNEVKELYDNCTWNWTTQSGVYGYRVTGPSGNSIFLPAAGHCMDGDVLHRDSYGIYWTSTLYKITCDCAYGLHFGTDNIVWNNYYDRFVGRTIRPVTD